MAHQQVITDIKTCEAFKMIPELKNAQLIDMSIWYEEMDEWYITFRVASPSGPGRDYIHVSIDADENQASPDSIRVSYSTSRFVRYMPTDHTEVFKTDLDPGESFFFSARVFNDLIQEQVHYLDLPGKRHLPGIKPHHLPLLFIAVVVDTLQEAKVLPQETFGTVFLPHLESSGFDIATLYAML